VKAVTTDRLSALYDRSRGNSIGFLRLFLAALVVYSHAFPLGGFGTDPPLVHADSVGGFAVACFFVLSGFLIARSYDVSGSAARYLWHRFLRIFPGFWICLLVTAFGFAPLIHWFSQRPHRLAGFIGGQPGPLAYLAANALLMMRQWGIDGLLADNPHPLALDGSLWTLIYEFRCYVAVALLGLVGLFSRFRRVGALVLAVIMLAFALKNSYAPSLLPLFQWLWGDRFGGPLTTWFFAGVLAYAVADHVPMTTSLFLVALLALLLSLCDGRLYHALAPLPLAYVLFFLALRLPLSWCDRRGDFSYGLYIYAYPVQQTLVFFGVQRLGVALLIAASFALTAPLAVASFVWIERPALRLKDVGRRRRDQTRSASSSSNSS
jgi:peptidoglycan/LPS O-acetylase OafA/YrhL